MRQSEKQAWNVLAQWNTSPRSKGTGESLRAVSRGVLAGLVVVVASAVGSHAAERRVPADYPTIQAAVDAASSGDTIRIAPGVYYEQVVITNNNLTLSGSPGTVLRATPYMQFSLRSVANAFEVCLLGVFESTNVVVSGLTFEGEHLADDQPYEFSAIFFLAAGGRVEDCRITGFRGDSIDSPNGGTGVAIVNRNSFGVGVMNLDVLRSTFADNLFSIALQGDAPTTVNTNWNPELLSTTFTVNDNTIVGNGPDDTGAQFGIFIEAGAGGEVKRNTITDFSYTGTNSIFNNSRWAFGIIADDGVDFENTNALAALQPMHFEGNIFRNNQIDMTLLRANGSTIVNNSFEGYASGLRPIGLAFSGENVVVSGNRFSDMPTGILLFGNDPEFGTYLGLASHAVLTANGFCNVATNYAYEPLTTHTEQDTLSCPLPTLHIQLSWPYSYAGYSVQTAPALGGPWSTSSARPFPQDGQNSVVIPADSDQQYFRLVKP